MNVFDLLYKSFDTARNKVKVDAELLGSNFEQTIDSAIPAKAALIGISDGTNIQAMRGNTQGTLLASAARTASVASAIQTNYNSNKLIVYLNVEVAGATGGLTLHVRGINPINGRTNRLNPAPAAVTAVGDYVYELSLGASGIGADVAQRTSGALPRTWDVAVYHTDAASYTYSVAYALIV